MARVKSCGSVLVVFVAAGLVGCRPPTRDGGGPVKAAAVDNSRCHVCHINYSEELLAVRHAKVGVGCEKCHGSSDAHCNDEGNITPPGIMYPKDKVNSACMACHAKASFVKVVNHKASLAAVEANTKVCTDCHGQHRLARRDVRWDKKTRKLLPEDKP